MKKVTKTLICTFVVAVMVLVMIPVMAAAQAAVPSNKRVIGYFTSWGIYGRDFHVSDIPVDKITHINYAFANISNDLVCVLGDPYADIDKFYPGDSSDEGALRGNFHQLQILKENNPHIRTLISIGGWTWSGKFSDAAITEQSRQKFANSCVEFITNYHFDGVDIDWEYPVGGGMSGGRPEDTVNYTLLLKELREQLDSQGVVDGRHYLLTIASPAGEANYQNIELDKIHAYLDWINIMTYDFHGGWDPVTNFNAPLYPHPSDPYGEYMQTRFNADYAVNGYLASGVPSGKIVMGMPFYGRGWSGVPNLNNGLFQQAGGVPQGTWESGMFDYWDLKENYLANGYTRHWSEESKVPWLYSPQTGIMISYDDPQSLGIKAEYVKDNQLGGVMFWEFSGDDSEDSLLNSLVADSWEEESPTVSVVNPNSALNTGPVNVTVTGTNFLSGAAVKLEKTGQTAIGAGNVAVASATEITCSFNITGAATGAWDILVTNPNGQSGTLPGGFSVTTSPKSDYNYGEVLQKAISFFDCQRSGDLPDDFRVQWRGDSATNDGSDVGKDLTGGLFDAGDQIKFNFPMSMSAGMLGWSMLEYKNAYEGMGQLDELLSVFKYSTDYLMKCHTAPNEYYYQVGDIDLDHNWWGPAEVMQMDRPSHKIDSNNPGSCVAADVAATLSMASMIYQESDPAYSAECLQHARELFTFADSTRSDDGFTAGQDCYKSYSGFWDELVWASVWLYRATGEASYLQKAEELVSQIIDYKGWMQSWDDKRQGAILLLAKETGKQEYRDFMESLLDDWVFGTGSIEHTSGGLACINESGGEWGRLRYAANASFLAFVYGDWVENPQLRTRYHDFAENQINYMLGDNPRNSSYVVGFGDNSPEHPHHGTAHSSWCDSITTPPNHRHTIYGALVGGPQAIDDFDYVDDIQDWVRNEVACDYNAGFTGAIARMCLTYGGTPDAQFPPLEEQGDEFFVEALLQDSQSNYTQIKAQVNNRSGWPARESNGLSFKYFMDLSEVLDSGYTPGDLTTQTFANEGATISPVCHYSGNIYYVTLDFSGTDIYPGGNDKYEKEVQFRIAAPSDATWDHSNDHSFQGLTTSLAKSENIPVYEDGVLLYGNEPDDQGSPKVNAINPTGALNSGPVNVTVTGTNFLSGATVKLEKSGQTAINADNVTVASDTGITCSFNITGATTGAWDVVVTNPDTRCGKLASGFTVGGQQQPAPTVLGITPHTGINNAPVEITNLSGMDFESGAAVKLARSGKNPINGTSVVVHSSNRITCSLDITKATPGNWDVAVTNPDGQTGTLKGGFNVDKPNPSITAVTPSSGLTGTAVAILGSGFGKARGDSEVLFDSTQVAEYTSWSDTRIEVKVPAVNTGEAQVKVVVAGESSNSSTFTVTGEGYTFSYYFAEGCTREGFEEWICLQNPGPETIEVNATYMLMGDDPIEKTYNVAPTSRASVFVNDEVGPGQDVSVKLKSEHEFFAERPMYFDYKSNQPNFSWSGGHCTTGTRSPRKDWYFAEGTTRNGFEEWICIQNPNPEAATARIDYVFPNSSTQRKQYALDPESRISVFVNGDIGPGQDVSVHVSADKPVVAERPMYFNYQGKWDGGHVVMGAGSPEKTWYFAEGTTREGFDEYLAVQNPNGSAATMAVDFLKSDGTRQEETYIVGANSRWTLDARTVLGSDVDASVTIRSDQPVVVERPMYFNYNGMWPGGHDVIGATSPANSWFFAEGCTQSGFDQYICVGNPGAEAADVTLEFMVETGVCVPPHALSLKPHQRATVKVSDFVESGHDVATLVTSTGPVVAERPVYFNYQGWTGGHDVVGFSR